MSVIVCKAEACACVVKDVVGINCVLKAACLSDYRHCAVAKSHKLRKAAGLKQRRHKESIAGSVYLVCHLFAVVDVCRYLVRVLACKVAEHILILIITCTEDYYLHVLLADILHHISDKVKALLVGKTADYTHKEAVVIKLQAKLCLESTLVVYLLFEDCLLVVFLVYHHILRRVELVIVDTVDDTTKVMLSCSHKPVKALAEERGLYLICIGLRNCSYCICIHKAAL